MRQIGAFRSWLLIMATGAGAFAAQADDVQKAREYYLRGRYREAMEAYDASKGEPAVVALGKCRCLEAEGKYDEAKGLLETALAAAPNADLFAELGEIQFRFGKWEETKAAVEKALALKADHLPARWLRCRLMMAAGKDQEVGPELDWFIVHYNDKQPTDAESLYLIGQAAIEHSIRNKNHDQLDFVLNTLLTDAAKADPNFWPINFLEGVLLVKKYNKTEGVPRLRSALEINPVAVEPLVWLGIASLQEYDFAEAHTFADQALGINPKHLEAIVLKADILLADNQTAKAAERLEEAKTLNPISEDVLGRLAACAFLSKRKEEALRLEKDVLTRNPRPAIFYNQLGENLERRRQYDPAEAYYLKAIQAAPYLPAPKNGLGMLYMATGREQDARKIFNEARDVDPFHARVANFTKVLDHLDGYKILESPNYEVWVNPDKDLLLGKYMLKFLEEHHQGWCDQYNHKPTGKTKIQILVDHKWFSARVVGLPRIGTVGACTGKVVAMASPRSLQQPYNWSRVLAHEVSHIHTLQQTNFNIPHWYTEALAVRAEAGPRPQIWNELLQERVPKGDLLNLDNINLAFVRPKTPLDWQMAYCQSLLYANFFIEKFGANKIGELLAAYRDGIETDAAIPKVFGIQKEELEQRYREFLKDLVAGMKQIVPKKSLTFAEAERQVRNNPKDADAAAELAFHHYRRRNNSKARELAEKALELKPNHPVAVMVLARMELSIGKIDDALKLAEPALDRNNVNPDLLELVAALYVRKKEYAKAVELYQQAAALDPLSAKWQQGLSRVYLLSGDESKLLEALTRVAEMDADDLSARKKLAELARNAKKWPEAERWGKEVLYINVADADAHRILAEAYLAQDKKADAIEELKVVIELAPTDAAARLRLAGLLLAAGQNAEAAKIVDETLEMDPENKEAKDLKDKLKAGK